MSNTRINKELLSQVANALGSGIPIFTEDPQGWDPKYYVLCVPTFSTSKTGDLTFEYDLKASGVYKITDLYAYNINSIQDFVNAVYRKTLATVPMTRPFESNPASLEFSLRQDAYIVMSLADLNWQFDQNYYAITIDPKYSYYYGNLNQLDRNGVPCQVPYDTSGPFPPRLPTILPPCKIAYFSANLAPAVNPPPQHPFNLHVEILQGGSPVSLRIDPDIKNDGNQPVWPP